MASVFCPLGQGSPTPGPRTATGPWLVRNWATQQEVSSGRAREQSFICIYSRSPSLALLPELHLLSNQRHIRFSQERKHIL